MSKYSSIICMYCIMYISCIICIYMSKYSNIPTLYACVVQNRVLAQFGEKLTTCKYI